MPMTVLHGERAMRQSIVVILEAHCLAHEERLLEAPCITGYGVGVKPRGKAPDALNVGGLVGLKAPASYFTLTLTATVLLPAL